jgi:hypothetical protein
MPVALDLRFHMDRPMPATYAAHAIPANQGFLLYVTGNRIFTSLKNQYFSELYTKTLPDRFIVPGVSVS